METYYITKGNKKVDTFYLNDLPYKFVHKSDKKENERDFEVDHLNFFRRLAPLKLFPMRKNSCVCFKSENEAKEYIEYAKRTIKSDNRFCERIKSELIQYLESFKISC